VDRATIQLAHALFHCDGHGAYSFLTQLSLLENRRLTTLCLITATGFAALIFIVLFEVLTLR
jgi:hypothetical protein